MSEKTTSYRIFFEHRHALKTVFGQIDLQSQDRQGSLDERAMHPEIVYHECSFHGIMILT